MAVSNAIGSNVFDILVCLGLPWFLDTAIVNPQDGPIKVTSKGIFLNTVCWEKFEWNYKTQQQDLSKKQDLIGYALEVQNIFWMKSQIEGLGSAANLARFKLI